MRPEIVPATTELLTRFLGKAPDRTMRAIVGLIGDEIWGIAALIPDGTRMTLHAQITPEGRRYRKFIVRGARQMMGIAKSIGAPVHAQADPDVPGADRFLERLGFVRIHPEVFEWPGSQ